MEGSHTEKVANQIAELAAQFFARESNRQSLITVTRADLSPDFAQSTIFFTVLPESAEETALDFAKRQRGEMRDFIKKRTNLKRIPFFDVAIDEGEKNRQRIDELTRDSNE